MLNEECAIFDERVRKTFSPHKMARISLPSMPTISYWKCNTKGSQTHCIISSSMKIFHIDSSFYLFIFGTLGIFGRSFS